MSLIGNRPLPFDNLVLLKKHKDWTRRFDSPAGMTGISQVVGKLNLTPKERLELEGLYSEVYEKGNILKCDILIIYYTIRLILFKKGISLERALEILRGCLR
jgi:lipopolysaccharide/colanic/teichoic acid biosynthesis glycosyltransferase